MKRTFNPVIIKVSLCLISRIFYSLNCMQTCNPFVSANLLRLRDLLIPSNCAINGGSEATSVEANFLLFNKTQKNKLQKIHFL